MRLPRGVAVAAGRRPPVAPRRAVGAAGSGPGVKAPPAPRRPARALRGPHSPHRAQDHAPSTRRASQGRRSGGRKGLRNRMARGRQVPLSRRPPVQPDAQGHRPAARLASRAARRAPASPPWPPRHLRRATSVRRRRVSTPPRCVRPALGHTGGRRVLTRTGPCPGATPAPQVSGPCPWTAGRRHDELTSADLIHGRSPQGRAPCGPGGPDLTVRTWRAWWRC